MTENHLISSIKNCIDRKLPIYNIRNFEVSRSAQPTDQFTGASVDSNIKTQIFLRQIARELIQNSPSEINEYRYTNRASTIQIDIFKWLDIKNFNDRSSFDVAEILGDMLFDRSTINELREVGIRLESRTPIRPNYFVNDNEKYESIASFDILLSYTSVLRTDVPEITNIAPFIINSFGKRE